MGNIDATVQSCGAQVANDVFAPLARQIPSDRALMVVSQAVMALLTIGAATIACLPLPSLFIVALFAFQIMVRLSVPLYFGTFSKFGDRRSALASMATGVILVLLLQGLWPLGIPRAYGLTTRAVALDQPCDLCCHSRSPATPQERARAA